MQQSFLIFGISIFIIKNNGCKNSEMPRNKTYKHITLNTAINDKFILFLINVQIQPYHFCMFCMNFIKHVKTVQRFSPLNFITEVHLPTLCGKLSGVV
jgi:hypothetical protein